MIRFLHTSDWHLGKPFGQMPEDLRGRLREARHGQIAGLAARARQHDCRHVLVAGDVWDSETPSEQVLRQALAALAAAGDLTWVLMPGNHDPGLEGGVWDRVARHAPPNVVLATAPQPMALAPGVVLLPSPPRASAAGRDLTAWMDGAATPPETIRIGLAHGSVRDFNSDIGQSSVLVPDRAERAGLAYLALGDWHGLVRVGPRTCYSGTPEPDRFKNNSAGQALVVAIAGPGAAPSLAPLVTGQFGWVDLALTLVPGDGPDKIALPPQRAPRDTLLSLGLGGALSLADRAVWDRALADLAPTLAHLACDDTGLTLLHDPADLDVIDRAGALRDAAEALAADPDPAARDALRLLYSWCLAEGAA